MSDLDQDETGPAQAMICKSNALIEASYKLSLYEQRIVLMAISQVRRDQVVTDDVIYIIRASDFAAACDIDLGSAYRQLNVAMDRLFDRQATVYQLPNGAGPVKPKRGKTGKVIRWIQTLDHDVPEGCVGIRFGRDILPYLSQLKEQFTQYALADISGMTSVYAIRLYELLQQWRGAGKRSVSIAWLRDALALGDRHTAINDFKKCVLKPAVEQINAETSLYVEWTQRKTGRRVTHFDFSFGVASERDARLADQADQARLKAEKAAAAQAKQAVKAKQAAESAARKAVMDEAQARHDAAQAMAEKPAWVDAENPPFEAEDKRDYWKRLAKIRGLETEPDDVA